MLSVPPCAACYLFDLGCWAGLEGPYGVFCEGFEYDMTDFPVFSLVLVNSRSDETYNSTHPNSIAPNHNIIPTFWIIKLLAPNLRWQPSINNRTPHPCLPLYRKLSCRQITSLFIHPQRNVSTTPPAKQEWMARLCSKNKIEMLKCWSRNEQS